MPVKMPTIRSRTKRPHGALLQLDIGLMIYDVQHRWETLKLATLVGSGVIIEIPPLLHCNSNLTVNLVRDSVWWVV